MSGLKTYSSGQWKDIICLASKLAVPVNINGVPFDGSASITLSTLDNTKLPLTGGTLTGTLATTDVAPTTDNTRLLGTSTSRWAKVHATEFVGTLNGNALTATAATSSTTADRLYIPRAITLTGNVTGSAAFDGSANANISTTITSTITAVNDTVLLSGTLSSGNINIAIRAATSSNHGTVMYATSTQVSEGTSTNTVMSPANVQSKIDEVVEMIRIPVETFQALGNKTGALAINAVSGNIVTFTATGALTITLNAGSAGYCRVLTLIITDGGNYIITWPTSVKWPGGTAPTLTSTGTDIITLITVDNGSTWLGMLGGAAFG